jgi:hypothetical protein
MLGFVKRGAYSLTPTPEELAKYDFNDKSSLAQTVWNVNITFIVLVGVIVGLRAFTRASVTGRFFIDDVLAIFAAFFTIVSATMSLVATRFGLGMHVWNLTPPLDNIMENIKHCVQVRHALLHFP